MNCRVRMCANPNATPNTATHESPNPIMEPATSAIASKPATNAKNTGKVRHRQSGSAGDAFTCAASGAAPPPPPRLRRRLLRLDDCRSSATATPAFDSAAARSLAGSRAA